jgi:TolB protein
MQPFPLSGGLLTTPAFSPDGKQLAFSARLDNASDTDIYIADLDGGNRRNITQHPGIDISPCWSPTGRQLAFASNRGGMPQIHICDVFGADLSCVTQESGYASSPDWSPDGRYIVFSWKPSRMARFDLYIIEVATKKIFQLTQGNGDNENPSWAPDGRHIVFQSDRSGSMEIFTMFADGSEVRQITNLQGCSNPDWSSYGPKN